MSVVADLFWGVVSCVVYIVYSAVQIMFYCVQRATSPSPDGYTNSCRVMNIIWRRKFFLIDVVTPKDFLAIHEALVHPSYVLKQNVSLYFVSRGEAIFVETPENVDIYSSKVSPFQYIGQFRHATKLIRLPIASFHTLADALGKPSVPVTYMANTGRCGSTILAQALENVPGTLVHAEPDCLTNICLMKKDTTVTNSERKKLLMSSLKILCKPMEGISRMCIKTRSCASTHMLTISKEFPEIKIIYGYRGSKATVSSFLGLMISETVQSLSLYIIDSDWWSEMLPYFRRKLHYYFVRALDTDPPLAPCEVMNSVEMFTYAWACCMKLVRDLKNQGGELLPVLYEDLLRDARKECEKVFSYLEIDHQHLEVAMVAFENDSQGSSPLSRQNIKNYERRRISDDNRLRANIIMSRFGLPSLGQDYML